MQDNVMCYPCNYCGECTAWLAAYVPEGLETHEDLLAECYRRKCPIVNTPVPEEDIHMAKYRLYAGLSGSFGGLVYQGTEEFKSQQEAEWRAYDIAWEEYESYGGNHGLLDWDACYEDALEAEWIDPHSQSQEEIERIVDEHYREQVESWIVYKAVFAGASSIDHDSDDDDYQDDDDADCYCE